MIQPIIFVHLSASSTKPCFKEAYIVIDFFRMRERELARQQATIGALGGGGAGGPSNFYQCKLHKV